MNRMIVGVFWIVLYLVVILSPLFILMAQPTPPARSFWVEFSFGLGFVGLIQISVQFALIARYKALTAPYGIDLILKYHRQIAQVAIVLLIAHPVILVLENPNLLGLLNPFAGTTASRVGNLALYALVALALLSLFRRQIRLDYELWRVTHAALGIAAVVLAHVHIYLAGHYTETLWKDITLIAISTLLIVAFLYLRLVKPARLRRAPYRVAEVHPEHGRTWSLALTPEGHAGMRFLPGQFAWLKLGDSPYTIEEHPFSFSSSALEPQRLEFGIKASGDFTRTIGEVPVGTTAYLDGPHGAFSIDLDPAPGYVFFAGGIGITPFMSMLRTMADRGDPRPVLLFYGTPTWDDTAYREALAALEDRLDLKIVYVLERPHEGWQGETGFCDLDLLKRHLPKEGIARQYFICGPEPMLVGVEKALQEYGVPLQQVRYERFGLV